MSSQTRFPGVAALIPCVGAALIIWAGEYQAAPLAKVLATPLLRFYGQISFSLYFIHWPLQCSRAWCSTILTRCCSWQEE